MKTCIPAARQRQYSYVFFATLHFLKGTGILFFFFFMTNLATRLVGWWEVSVFVYVRARARMCTCERIAHVCIPPPKEIKRQTPSRVSSEPDPELQEGKRSQLQLAPTFLHSSRYKNLFSFSLFVNRSERCTKKRCQLQNRFLPKSGRTPSDCLFSTKVML